MQLLQGHSQGHLIAIIASRKFEYHLTLGHSTRDENRLAVSLEFLVKPLYLQLSQPSFTTSQKSFTTSFLATTGLLFSIPL